MLHALQAIKDSAGAPEADLFDEIATRLGDLLRIEDSTAIFAEVFATEGSLFWDGDAMPSHRLRLRAIVALYGVAILQAGSVRMRLIEQ